MFKNTVKFAVLVLVLATFAWVPAASALPGQCDDVCTCNSLCTQKCAVGGAVTTCGIGGICRNDCLNAAPSVEKVDSKEAFLASLAKESVVAEAPAAAAAAAAR